MESVRVRDMIFSEAYVQIFDLLDDCIIVVDVDGKIVLYNKASELLDEMDRKNVIGRHMGDVFQIGEYTGITLKTLQTKKPM